MSRSRRSSLRRRWQDLDRGWQATVLAGVVVASRFVVQVA
jgi:hypothetical protein